MVTPYAAAASVVDPELPLVTIAELGILREVTEDPGGRVTVSITPTYSGCPALDAIRADIATDQITAAGREKLAAAGIAPPGPVLLQIRPRCPVCGSPDTEELSRFGSTACKALWRCRTCAEPFDAVKPL
ncbi:MAG: phenylacetate-CoA oxygenase subunit PaaJ [Actinobacteria bacterium 13_1_20CM_3_71_11]|nr:MAG: phenylacetate-CoA oxygenase subunit PaaJ [Actinobacteria bacterium 13_1_20CM_3_71_11]